MVARTRTRTVRANVAHATWPRYRQIGSDMAHNGLMLAVLLVLGAILVLLAVLSVIPFVFFYVGLVLLVVALVLVVVPHVRAR